MPTLPLYKPAGVADASHDVTAPGGYEWWYFDAEDPEYDRRLVAILLNGFIFHPGYLRAHARWNRNPTRHSPPLPHEYACAYLIVYQGDVITHQFMTQYPASQYSARTDAPDVTVGPNRFRFEGLAAKLDLSGTPWVLTWQGPKLLTDRKLEAQLSFTPRISCPPQERIFLSKELSGADHHWIVANPLCDVRARINCGDDSIDFRGMGYHDHNYGTAPIGPGLHRWLWGRILFGDSAYTFHYAHPKDSTLPDEVHLLEADMRGMRELPIKTVESEWTESSSWHLKYPRVLKFDDAVELSHPRVIDSSPFYLRLLFTARVRERRGTAFCELAYPHRLRWPILGRMIEMSIHKP